MIALAFLLTVSAAPDDLREELTECLRGLDARGGGGVEEAYRELAPRAQELGALPFEILAAGVLEGAPVPEGGPSRPLALNGPQRALLLELLAANDPAWLRGLVLDHVDPDGTLSARRAALAVLERVGRIQELDAAIAIAGLDGSDRHVLDRELVAVVGTLLARDGGAGPALRERLADEQGALRSCLVRGIGRSASREGLALLSGALFDDDPQVVELLESLADLARALGGPFGERERDAVEYLLWSRPVVAEAAAEAAGVLGGHRLVPSLLELLRSPAPRARAAARRALVELSGRAFGADPEAWEAWYRRERTWWGESWPESARVLEQGEPRALAATLAELATHPLYRDDVAPPVERLLDHASGTVVRLACSCLAQLGARRAVPRLVTLLDDEDPSVSAAARSALRRLTAGSPPPATATRLAPLAPR